MTDQPIPGATVQPLVLFVCVHNAGRSQMAAGYLTAFAGGRINVRSAGSIPGDKVNPVAVHAMAEEGIDISTQNPKLLTTESVQAADVVITMGCGDACPIFPGKRYEDWELEDPAGKGIDTVRRVRDDIRARVETLITELLPNRSVTAMTSPHTTRRSVLFVCEKNGGKSQMAAGLMRNIAGDTIAVDSAGTKPAARINALSAQTLLEVGVDITNETPKQLTDDLIHRADLVVVLGRDATVDPVDGTPVEIWDTDEPSERGIDGIERMRLVRDDINRRVQQLAERTTRA